VGHDYRAGRGRKYSAHVGSAEAIIGAGAEGSRPHFFVGDTMIAQDADALKFAGQGFDIGDRRRLKIEHYGKRPLARHYFVQIRNASHNMHAMKRIREGSDQSLRDLRITLEQNNIGGLHNYLICRYTAAAEAPATGREV
jgi:hypothetical protein